MLTRLFYPAAWVWVRVRRRVPRLRSKAWFTAKFVADSNRRAKIADPVDRFFDAIE